MQPPVVDWSVFAFWWPPCGRWGKAGVPAAFATRVPKAVERINLQPMLGYEFSWKNVDTWLMNINDMHTNGLCSKVGRELFDAICALKPNSDQFKAPFESVLGFCSNLPFEVQGSASATDDAIHAIDALDASLAIDATDTDDAHGFDDAHGVLYGIHGDVHGDVDGHPRDANGDATNATTSHKSQWATGADVEFAVSELKSTESPEGSYPWCPFGGWLAHLFWFAFWLVLGWFSSFGEFHMFHTFKPHSAQVARLAQAWLDRGSKDKGEKEKRKRKSKVVTWLENCCIFSWFSWLITYRNWGECLWKVERQDVKLHESWSRKVESSWANWGFDSGNRSLPSSEGLRLSCERMPNNCC